MKFMDSQLKKLNIGIVGPMMGLPDITQSLKQQGYEPNFIQLENKQYQTDDLHIVLEPKLPEQKIQLLDMDNYLFTDSFKDGLDKVFKMHNFDFGPDLDSYQFYDPTEPYNPGVNNGKAGKKKRAKGCFGKCKQGK